ncbi:MAG: PEP-CTERM sorting domain-containing protein [Gemmatirosa sp.]
MSLALRTPRGARTRLAALAAGAALALCAPAPAAAQTVTVACARADAAGCAALRFVLVAGSAPWILQTFALQLQDGWSFRAADGDPTRTPFSGIDSYTVGDPFTGAAARPDARTALVDFLVNPGFAFELAPEAEGSLEFAVSGTGPLDVAYRLADLDGEVTDGSGPVVTTTPEPATGALLLGGGAWLAVIARRRRTRAEGR